jgi:hypothetical protein
LARGGSALLSDGSIRNKVFRLGTAELPSATLLKEFLGPIVVVTSLALCRSIFGAHLSLESSALGLIVFLVSNRILSTPETRTDASGQQRIRPTWLRLLLEWSTISALVTFLASALSFTNLFPRGALVTWFIVTPRSAVGIQLRRDPPDAVADVAARPAPPHHHRRHRDWPGAREARRTG